MKLYSYFVYIAYITREWAGASTMMQSEKMDSPSSTDAGKHFRYMADQSRFATDTSRDDVRAALEAMKQTLGPQPTDVAPSGNSFTNVGSEAATISGSDAQESRESVSLRGSATAPSGMQPSPQGITRFQGSKDLSNHESIDLVPTGEDHTSPEPTATEDGLLYTVPPPEVPATQPIRTSPLSRVSSSQSSSSVNSQASSSRSASSSPGSTSTSKSSSNLRGSKTSVRTHYKSGSSSSTTTITVPSEKKSRRVTHFKITVTTHHRRKRGLRGSSSVPQSP